MASIRTIWEFKSKCRQGIPILIFHKVGRWPASANMSQFYVSPAHFDKLLSEFKRKNFRSIPLSDDLQPNTEVGNCFVISFDDGFEGVLIDAAQKIKEHGTAPFFCRCSKGNLILLSEKECRSSCQNSS